MKCPYCAEEIQDEALVCRHCGREFWLGKPILKRLDSMERKVESLHDQLSLDSLTSLLVPVAILMCVFLTSGYFLLAYGLRAPGLKSELIEIFKNYGLATKLAILLPPTFFGLSLGLTWRRGQLTTYFVLGFTFGLVNLIVLASLPRFLPIPGNFNWFWGVPVFALGQPAIFTSAGLLGRTFQRRFISPSADAGPLRLSDLEIVLTKAAEGSKNLDLLLSSVPNILSHWLAIIAIRNLFPEGS